MISNESHRVSDRRNILRGSCLLEFVDEGGVVVDAVLENIVREIRVDFIYKVYIFATVNDDVLERLDRLEFPGDIGTLAGYHVAEIGRVPGRLIRKIQRDIFMQIIIPSGAKPESGVVHYPGDVLLT